ncbi:hypothetical protein BGZ60DRAFT_486323 [Tricladium varicosporioides]|nr:hypothetical protein BGZ60DRAFT_486323 [Hymenoscyphus varicosporioides]
MVNTGKPSKGCYMCRSRRIKCDEGKPSCMRCQKSKRVCPGYRDAFELNLRDETKSTKKKMSRMMNHRSFVDGVTTQFDSQHELINSPEALLLTAPITSANLNIYDTFVPPWSSFTTNGHSPRSSISSNSSGDVSTSNTSISSQSMILHSRCLSRHLSTPIDQQAACFFLSNFVLLPEQGVLRGYLEFMIPHLTDERPNPAFLSAFSAVALAALGTRPNSKALLPKADITYVKALKKINTTLRDPKMASEDSTLTAVLLLSFFEQLTAPRLNPEAWSSHVDGAVALLKARGPDAFQSNTGREVWNTVRAMMAIQCIANSRKVDLGVEWWMSVPAKDDLSQQFASLNIRVADLRWDTDNATVLPHALENYEEVLRILRRAEDLEREYVEWFNKLKGNWECKSVAWINSTDVMDLTTSLVHPGRVDSYSEMWMVYHHNIGRSSRLFIWVTILRCVAWLCDSRDYRLTPEYTKAQTVCRQLIEDTVASVPYIFGWNKETDPLMADNSSFACGMNDTTTVKSLWGIFVMWPLFAAATSDFVLPSQETFLRARLTYISETLGIYQASVLLKATIRVPSLYIDRAKMSMNIHTCREKGAEGLEFLAGSPKTKHKSRPSLSDTSASPTSNVKSTSPVYFTTPEKEPYYTDHLNMNPFIFSEDVGFASDRIHEFMSFTAV